jgi:hypothetical protein
MPEELRYWGLRHNVYLVTYVGDMTWDMTSHHRNTATATGTRTDVG